jgi:hypothetical protein
MQGGAAAASLVDVVSEVMNADVILVHQRAKRKSGVECPL